MVDLKTETIKYLGTFKAQAHGKAEGVIVQMTCYTAEYEGTLQVASEVETMAWLDTSVDYAELSPVDRIIFDYLKEKTLID